MKRITILYVFCFLTFVSCAQTDKKSIKNLDFEFIENGNAVGWSYSGKGNYSFKIDTILFYNGERSASIEFEGGVPNFNRCSLFFNYKRMKKVKHYAYPHQ